MTLFLDKGSAGRSCHVDIVSGRNTGELPGASLPTTESCWPPQVPISLSFSSAEKAGTSLANYS